MPISHKMAIGHASSSLTIGKYCRPLTVYYPFVGCLGFVKM